MSRQGDELSTALHQAIGANTRTILARVVAIDHIDRNRVTAFSEMIGNLEVVVGNIRWLKVNDVIIVQRAASEEKYQPNIYIAWAGNLADNTPGTPTLLNTGTVALVTDLPTGARVGDLRIVGGTIDGITGKLVGASTYVYAQISDGVYQWIGVGSGVVTATDTQLLFLGHMTTGTLVGGSGYVTTFPFDGVELDPRSIVYGTGSIASAATSPTSGGWSIIIPQTGLYEISAATFYGPSGDTAPGRWPDLPDTVGSLYSVDTKLFLVSSLIPADNPLFDSWGVLDQDFFVTYNNAVVLRSDGTYTGTFTAGERIWVAMYLGLGGPPMSSFPNAENAEGFKSWLSVKYFATSAIVAP